MAVGTTQAAKRVDLTWLRTRGFFPRGGGIVEGSIQWSSYGKTTGDIRVFLNTLANPSIRLQYKTRDRFSNDDWKSFDYHLPLERISCRYGGYKWFVRCQIFKNGAFCGRRVRVLYCLGNYFGCRHCGSLTYDSSRLGGRYKGFLSAVDVDNMFEKVKRTHYGGKPTKKYLRYLKSEEKFENGFLTALLKLKAR